MPSIQSNIKRCIHNWKKYVKQSIEIEPEMIQMLKLLHSDLEKKIMIKWFLEVNWKVRQYAERVNLLDSKSQQRYVPQKMSEMIHGNQME